MTQIHMEHGVKHEKRTCLQKLQKIPAMGILFAIGSGFFFTTGSLLVKLLNHYHAVEVLTFRAVVQIAVYSVVVLCKRHSLVATPGEKWFLLFRSMTGFISVSMLYASYRLIPLGDASTISLSAPIFVGVFARFLLKEECSIFQVATTSTVMVGVVLISRPPFLFDPTLTDEETYRLEGTLLALGGAIFNALTLISVRRLQKTPTPVVIWNNSFFIIIFGVIYLFSFHSINIPTDTFDIALILAVGVLGTFGQLCLTVALKIEQAGPVSLARTLSIVIAFVYQILLLHEPSFWTSFVGSAIVVSAVVASGLRKWHQQNPDAFRMFCSTTKAYDLSDAEKAANVVTVKTITKIREDLAVRF